MWFPAESSVCTAAVCAGSGASVLNGVTADLYITGGHLKHYHELHSKRFQIMTFFTFTLRAVVMIVSLGPGEMSHHEVLDAAAAGTSVILSDQSNSERGFLAVFREKLAVRLPDSVTVAVSKADRDPLEVV